MNGTNLTLTLDKKLGNDRLGIWPTMDFIRRCCWYILPRRKPLLWLWHHKTNIFIGPAKTPRSVMQT
jgi:hypothetical protein